MTSKKLYKDVISIICSFLPEYKLRDWIDKKNLVYDSLTRNSSLGAIQMLENNLNKIYFRSSFFCLSENPIAINLIEKELKENPDSEIIFWVYV